VSRLAIGLLLVAACTSETKSTAASDPRAKTTSAKEPVTRAGPATPSAARVPDDWILWYQDKAGWHTRWIDVATEAPITVAEREALVTSNGADLWLVRRQDTETQVLPCICIEEEDHADCKPTGTLQVPGLVATQLGSKTKNVLVDSTAYDMGTDSGIWGSDMSFSIQIEGGVGSHLFIETGADGYFCGAHGSYEHSFFVVDVATGDKVDIDLAAVGKMQPETVRRPAAEAIFPLYHDCEEEPGVTQDVVMNERMTMESLEVSLRKGRPSLRWHYEAPVMYACSPDYAAHGHGDSGLGPPAGALRLGEPPPFAVMAAMAEIDEAFTVGWADVTATGAARTEALAQFGAVSEDPWPDDVSSDQPLPSAAGPDPKAKELAKAGRAATRAGNYEEAIRSFDAAVGADPKYARAFAGRGYAKLLAGELEGAKQDCTAALKLDHDPHFEAAVYFNLGQIAERQGDAAAAKKAYTNSQERRDSKQVQKALAGLP
jgi:hypothetical protein